MKTKPRRSHRYVNYDAIPAREYKPAAANPAANPIPSQKEISGLKHRITEGQVHSNSLVKVQPAQQFRQDRTGGRKLPGTSLGWRSKRSTQRNAGSNNHR